MHHSVSETGPADTPRTYATGFVNVDLPKAGTRWQSQ
jgi:hypothetical protein